MSDRFKLVRQLAHGGMGTVWLAHHEALDAPCAVKFVAANLEADAEALARFEREAKAAARIRSPHVVQIFDYGEWDGKHYIAMEYLDGEDLADRLERCGRLTPTQIYEVVDQVCRALTKAHDARIVHRDLKPGNIYLVKEKHGDHVKVLDFGIAKAAIEGSSKTKTGAMLGTPYYMSPEQIDGVATIDHRSDLWSLAVITYECLIGEMPFEHDALSQLITKIIHEPLPIPSEHASVPEGFDAWWRTAAARDPDDRFQDADAFLTSLADALGLARKTPAPMTSSPALHAEPQSSATADRATEPTSEPLATDPSSEPPASEPPVSDTAMSEPPVSESPVSESPVSEPLDRDAIGRAATLRSDSRELASTDMPLSKSTTAEDVVPVRRAPLPMVIAVAVAVVGFVVWILTTGEVADPLPPGATSATPDRAATPSGTHPAPPPTPAAEPAADDGTESAASSGTTSSGTKSSDTPAPSAPPPSVGGPLPRPTAPQPSAKPSAPSPKPTATPAVDKDHGF